MVNKVQLIGHLGKDPEVNTTSTGRKVANVTMATTERWTQNGEKKEDVQWHNLTIWGPLAEVAEKHWKKGSHLAVDGRLSYSSYDDKDGNKKYRTDIVVQNFTFLDKKSSEENVKQNNHPDDNLPF